MLCKIKKNSKVITAIILIFGFLSLVFGVYASKVLDESQHNLMMLAGMFAGMGTAFIAIVIIATIKEKITSPEKKKEKEIEKNDERNIQVVRAAYTVAATASIIIMAVAAFVFVGMNYMIPGFIIVGCMYIEAIVFFIAYKILNKKM